MERVFHGGMKPPFDIYVNQAGYLPYGAKIAAFAFPAKQFSLIDERGQVRYSGEVTCFGRDECSGDTVYNADFSDFSETGRYIVCAEGKYSPLFDISPNAYRDVFEKTEKAFYFLRCGCALEPQYAGAFTHGKCHTGKALICGDNGEKPEENAETAEVSSGWHDAGDYGRYSTAASCTLGHLLYAYKLFPTAFKNQNLNIPESGGAMPDILAECRYELEWLLKMQRPDGGVYHKLTTAHHAPFVMPEEDKAQLYLLPVSSSATADFCAVCALASGVYREYDSTFSDKLMSAAEKACNKIIEDRSFKGFENPDWCGTGSYGEGDDSDNRFWAFAEMFAATGEEKYHEEMKKALEKDFFRVGFYCGAVGGFGALSYILSDREIKDNALCEQLRQEFFSAAKHQAELSDGSGYGAAMTVRNYNWGSNMCLSVSAMTFVIADYLKGERSYEKYALRQLDCLMGANPLGISYITGVGEFSCRNPHYRPAFADVIEEPIPGMVSGGPNKNLDDEAARQVIPAGTPPMKCYADITPSYSTNEIAIYWNSPVVFALAYFNR